MEILFPSLIWLRAPFVDFFTESFPNSSYIHNIIRV